MISYEPFWKTIKKKSLTNYFLIEKLNVKESTLYRMRKGKPMTTTTLDDLCRALDCDIEDIVKYIKE